MSFIIRRSESGYPSSIDDENGLTIIHINPTERTMDNIDRIVRMLNEHELLVSENMKGGTK